MPREEQIKQAAYYYINTSAVQAGNEQLAFGDFINGAKWADEHPDLYSVTRKAVEREREYLIEKALKFLLDYDPNDYLEEIADFGVYELNEEKVKTAFYKAMEQ